MVLEFWFGLKSQNSQNSKTTFIVQTFSKYGPYDFYFMNLSLLGAILATLQFCRFSGLFWPFFPCKKGWTENSRLSNEDGLKSKHCQRHNGPEGWVHLTKVTSWGHITISQILIKFHLQNLDLRINFSTKHQHLQ